jgi:hypothetical protein
MSTETVVEWEQSPQCGKLYGALAKAQGKLGNVAKGKDNPFFKSKYADLATVIDEIRGPLAENELCVLQMPFTRGEAVGVRTEIGHSSGEWKACHALVTPKDKGPQAFGSTVSYLKRYALQAFMLVASEDDDGEVAEGRDKAAKPPGASWGKRNDPKGQAPQGRRDEATRGATTATTANRPAGMTSATPMNDTGEVLDAGQLADLIEAFDSKWGRGAKTAAPSWLKANYGTDNVAALTKVQAGEALQKLLASAS